MLDKFNLSLTIISTGGFQSSRLILNNFDQIIVSILLIFSSLNILILGILKINNFTPMKKRNTFYLHLFSLH